jgi:hypothetical protein
LLVVVLISLIFLVFTVPLRNKADND